MRSARVVAIVLIGGALVAGLALDAAEDEPTTSPGTSAVRAGVAIPAAAPGSALSSTWFCAGGTPTENGLADHVLLLANPTDEAREATVTVLPGDIAESVSAAEGTTGSSTTTGSTSTTVATTTTTVPPPEPTTVEMPPQSRVDVALADLVDSPLAGAVVEVDGGEVVVEHQITGEGGRATAPCSTTAAREWSFPWGVTTRGTKYLMVFMNPFPDDATVDIEFATDEGTRDTLRFRGFVVPGRSVVGAYIDEDVTRKAQVSAQVHVRGGRIVVDRIQLFDGTDPAFEGVTLGLGAPTPAEVWVFPDGKVGEGVTEQVVVFNPSDEVAEIDVEARLDDPEANGVPEPFELTIPPGRYSIVDLGAPDGGDPEAGSRIPPDVGHSIIVHSLNGVPVTAERVVTSSEPNANVGVGATLGSPMLGSTWLFAGGGLSDERDEYITLYNGSLTDEVTVSFTALADGQTIALADLQDVVLAPGTRRSVRLSDHIDDRESLPLVVRADGPIVAERGLFRVGGRGISLSMGIPRAEQTSVPDPVNS